MTFSYAQILAAVTREHLPTDIRDIDLPLLESEHRLGVGRDGEGSFVLVGPGQADAQPLTGPHYRFEPWRTLVDRKSGVEFKDVCVLRFRHADDDVDAREAISAVFTGLIEIARSTPNDLGRAVEAMRGLFEAGLVSSVPRDTEVGLAGELLVIAESADPHGLVSRWHSRPAGLFDFSAQGERLEVKTTTGPDRTHWFSSGQLAPIPGVCTTFVSVVLPLVEVGSTVASVFSDLSALTAKDRARVRSVIVDTTGEPPELLSSVVFDRAAARVSLRHVMADSVPAPAPTPGVGRMRWEASLSGAAPALSDDCRLAALLGF